MRSILVTLGFFWDWFASYKSHLSLLKSNFCTRLSFLKKVHRTS